MTAPGGKTVFEPASKPLQAPKHLRIAIKRDEPRSNRAFWSLYVDAASLQQHGSGGKPHTATRAGEATAQPRSDQTTWLTASRVASGKLVYPMQETREIETVGLQAFWHSRQGWHFYRAPEFKACSGSGWQQVMRKHVSPRAWST